MEQVFDAETSTIETFEFKTYKERGEWDELLFMAAAASHGYCHSAATSAARFVTLELDRWVPHFWPVLPEVGIFG